MVQFAQGTDLGMDALKLVVGIRYLPEVQHAHIDVRRTPLLIYTDNPETKQIGSGIYSEYGTSLSQ